MRNLLTCLAGATLAVAVTVISSGGDDNGPNPGGPAMTTPDVYAIYTDSVSISDADVWTWDGSDWDLAAGVFDGSHADSAAPEGGARFFCQSGAGGDNYAGWGVFLTKRSDHTTNLGAHTHLRFWVKSPADLKIEVQFGGRTGAKRSAHISSHGWDGTDTWQEISIPRSAFSGGDLKNVFGVFMATAQGSSQTFYVDEVRWIKE